MKTHDELNMEEDLAPWGDDQRWVDWNEVAQARWAMAGACGAQMSRAKIAQIGRGLKVRRTQIDGAVAVSVKTADDRVTLRRIVGPAGARGLEGQVIASLATLVIDAAELHQELCTFEPAFSSLER